MTTLINMSRRCKTIASSLQNRLRKTSIVWSLFPCAEERFYYSRFHGTLDAFQTSGFHLSSPPSSQVFQKRLAYILKVLDADYARKIAPQITDDQVNAARSLFGVFVRRVSQEVVRPERVLAPLKLTEICGGR